MMLLAISVTTTWNRYHDDMSPRLPWGQWATSSEVNRPMGSVAIWNVFIWPRWNMERLFLMVCGCEVPSTPLSTMWRSFWVPAPFLSDVYTLTSYPANITHTLRWKLSSGSRQKVVQNAANFVLDGNHFISQDNNKSRNGLIKYSSLQWTCHFTTAGSKHRNINALQCYYLETIIILWFGFFCLQIQIQVQVHPNCCMAKWWRRLNINLPVSVWVFAFVAIETELFPVLVSSFRVTSDPTVKPRPHGKECVLPRVGLVMLICSISQGGQLVQPSSNTCISSTT